MNRSVRAAICAFLALLSLLPVSASALQQVDTPDYKVAFYSFDCYHMMDASGKHSGYGYEMMQGLAKYLQCTFSYVGYDKTAAECEELLRNGEIDIYTAAKRTPEREAEFVFSTHPAITSATCMNVKVGNKKIIAGDYSTYDGLRIGLLTRHTYNEKFMEFVREKGFSCDIVYYDTPTELTNALVNNEVDALVDSYIRIPEDQRIIENFGETPYYIMARREDRALIDMLDSAMDSMSVETPNWRTELYNKYYGTVETNRTLTAAETALLHDLLEDGTVIRAVMNPDANPYAWYEDGEACGIAADVFRATAEALNLSYEIIPVESRAEYEALLASGTVDVWIDMASYYDQEDMNRYKATGAYLSTTTSVLRIRGASEKIGTLVTDNEHIAMKEIVASTWPNARVVVVDSLDDCAKMVLNGEADAALLLSYTAQRLARDDIQNRLRADVVPGGSIEVSMGISATDDVHFYGLWEKTLAEVAENVSSGIVQTYLEQTASPTFLEYLFDHPTYLLVICTGVILLLSILLLYVLSARGRKKQEKIAGELAVALGRAEEATRAKQDFFSKMSHDIRTPLNVVLGMTQIAQKYKSNPIKLESALENIRSEGNYLLMLINSILDVNQLEHGSVELVNEAFDPAVCLTECAEMLRPLAGKKEQTMTVHCDGEDRMVIGDENRLKQILINIVSNAIKYTGNYGHIDLRMDCLPDDRYRFTCTDDGIGMTPEFVSRICEEYTRAEDSRVSKIQGTGLGMSVVKGFTDLMGGTLTIHSEPGHGSSFIVEIPFAPAPADACKDETEQKAADAERPDYTGKRVLLVEDNALNAEIAAELLQSVGLAVDWAEDGEAGVRRYEASANGTYFAIFMDMQMPVLDGVAATRKIRGSARPDRDIPIFAMTANTFATDRQRCREAGMTGYISKPVSIKNIENALDEIAKHHADRAGSGTTANPA